MSRLLTRVPQSSGRYLCYGPPKRPTRPEFGISCPRCPVIEVPGRPHKDSYKYTIGESNPLVSRECAEHIRWLDIGGR